MNKEKYCKQCNLLPVYKGRNYCNKCVYKNRRDKYAEFDRVKAREYYQNIRNTKKLLIEIVKKKELSKRENECYQWIDKMHKQNLMADEYDIFVHLITYYYDIVKDQRDDVKLQNMWDFLNEWYIKRNQLHKQ